MAIVGALTAAAILGTVLGLPWYQGNQAYAQTSARADELLQEIGCPDGADPEIRRYDDVVRGSARVSCWDPEVLPQTNTHIDVIPSGTSWEDYYWDQAYGDHVGSGGGWVCDSPFNDRGDGLYVMHGEDWILMTWDRNVVRQAHGAVAEIICTTNPIYG